MSIVSQNNSKENALLDCGLRKLTVGINGIEFTHDAQIKYLA